MNKTIPITIFIFSLILLSTPSVAMDSKELKNQQKAAMKERKSLKSERSVLLREKRKAFKEKSKQIVQDYHEQAREMNEAFQIKKVELQAKHEEKVIKAQAEYQQKLSTLLLQRDKQDSNQAMEILVSQAKTFSNDLFTLKKASALEIHQAQIDFEQQKDTLLSERDKMILDEAESQGLTKNYEPILAKPIDDKLSKNKEKWNKKERKEVKKIEELNQKMIKGEYRYGSTLRQWQIQNLKEDFKLEWGKEAELHQAAFMQNIGSQLLIPSEQNKKATSEEMMNKIIEYNQKLQTIQNKYKKIASQNRIKRNGEKKKLLQGKSL